MSVDIGPRIGVDGEAEFRKSLANINQQIKTLGSEMKAVTSAFEGNEHSQEALAAQADVLNRQIDAQEQKLSALQSMLEQSAQRYGENDTRTLRWAQAVQDATADLNRMRNQLSRTEREMDGLTDAADDAADAMDDVGGASSGLGDMLKSAILGGGIVAGIQSIAGGILDLVESTTEYRKIMASLKVSSQDAGYSAQETADTYRQLYGVLGDDQTAATATANLQAVGLAQKQLTQLTNASIGAWAKYGDSIPIDGLSEAINETIKVGTVTGTFADVLNWAGVSEYAFNAKLEAAATPAERANLVLQQLASQGLVQAGEAWQQNNADIVATNQAQASLNQTMADFGGILSPVVAEAKQGLNELLSGVLSVVQAFRENGLTGAVEQAGVLVGQFVEHIKTNAPQMLAASQELMGQLVQGVVENIPSVIDGFSQTVTDVLNFLAEHLPDMIRTGGEMLANFVQGVIEGIPAMLQNLPQIITAFLSFIARNLPAIAEAGISLIGGLIKGLISAIPELVNSLPAIISAIANGIVELMGSIVDVGAQIVEGIWKGIQGMAKWLTNKVTGFFSGIVDGVKDFLGIRSPSKVFETEVGRYMAQGIGVGFENEMTHVARQVDQSIAQLSESPASFSVSASTSPAGAMGAAAASRESASAIAAAVRSALQGAGVYLNGRRVGVLVTQSQNSAAVARGQSQVYV